MTVPRKVYIYKKANMNGIDQHLDKENINVFTNYSKTNSIQECWGEFKEILSQAIATNIPTTCLHQDGMYLGSLEKLKH